MSDVSETNAPVNSDELGSATVVISPEPVLKPLTPRQQAFVEQYLIDNNGKQAAIRAGFSAHTAAEQAVRLLSDVNVASAIEKNRAQRSARINVTQDQVLQEMALLANSSVEHYTIDDEGYLAAKPDAPDGAMRAVQSIKRRKIVKESAEGDITITYETEFKLWDKPTPLKLMGRHTGLFPNRVEVTGKDGTPIELAALTSDQLKEKAKKLVEVAGTLKE